MAINPFEIVKDINGPKKNLLRDGSITQADYVAYVINKSFSYFRDTVLIANEMNIRHDLSPDMQYDFYVAMVPKGKRFSKWFKPSEDLNITAIQEYYGFSREKAKFAAKVLNEAQLEKIKASLEHGGESKVKHGGAIIRD